MDSTTTNYIIRETRAVLRSREARAKLLDRLAQPAIIGAGIALAIVAVLTVLSARMSCEARYAPLDRAGLTQLINRM